MRWITLGMMVYVVAIAIAAFHPAGLIVIVVESFAVVGLMVVSNRRTLRVANRIRSG